MACALRPARPAIPSWVSPLASRASRSAAANESTTTASLPYAQDTLVTPVGCTVGLMLDHLVYATDDLEKTVRDFAAATGVQPAYPPPNDGIVPFLIDWGTSRHPAGSGLPAAELVEFGATYPRPADVIAVLDALQVTLPVAAGEPGLRAVVAGPDGSYSLR
jgi:hypothetical protein